MQFPNDASLPMDYPQCYTGHDLAQEVKLRTYAAVPLK